ncbi:hypothetical protein FCOIX_2308 [Fusarium coicis]|nr:hypothetical protein FCOIX_2308 [Fusarium coicis]
MDPFEIYDDSVSDREFSELLADGLDLSGEDKEPQVLPRCCLCCFKFEPYDSIAVSNPRNLRLLSLWAGEYKEPERIEPTDWKSAETRPLEKGYHSECVDLVAKGLPSADYIHRTIKGRIGYEIGYSELLPSMEAARVHRLQKRFGQDLMAIVAYRLPLEICENIGRYSLSGYTTNLINDVWSNKDFAGPRHASLRMTDSSSIWAQHVEFEGLQYIKSLSTARRTESDTKLFEATPGVVVSVYFAEDCLGVREVLITRDDHTPSLNQDEGLRWVINRRKPLPFSFRYKTDGLKLRDLAITKSKDAKAEYRQRRWAALPKYLDTSQLAPPKPGCNFEVSNEPIRAVDWNLPGCRGYSILIDHFTICDIISHNTEGSSSRLADVSNENKGDWFYIPVDRDERIAELWLRIEDHGYTWSYNSLINKISKFWMGFERKRTWENHAIGIIYPNLPKRIPFLREELLSSNAELWDVRAVAVCRNWRYSKDAGIVGMLLTYADGHQRSLGQIRLDYMEAPLTISSEKIWLGSDKSENEPLPEGSWLEANKIKWFDVDKPIENENRQYLEIPLTGSLEWESYSNGGYWQHTVRHRESSEMRNEMDQVLAREARNGRRPRRVVKRFSVAI